MNHQYLRWIYIPIVIVLVPALQGCSEYPVTASGGPVSGQVIEDGSERPVAGAYVVAWWQGDGPHSNTVCFHVETAITDDLGRYHIPAWKKVHKFGKSDDQRFWVKPYKAGYRWSMTHTENELRSLALDTGTSEQRLKYLLKELPACDSQDESEKNLIPFMRAVYEEAKSIAATIEDKKVLNFILYHLEIIELGLDAADKRFLEQAKALN